MGNLGSSYSNLGRHSEALAMRESVLEFRRRVLPADHPDIGEGHKFFLFHSPFALFVMFFSAMACCVLSARLLQSRALPRALELAREALRIWQFVLPPGHRHLLKAEKLVRGLEQVMR